VRGALSPINPPAREGQSGEGHEQEKSSDQVEENVQAQVNSGLQKSKAQDKQERK